MSCLLVVRKLQIYAAQNILGDIFAAQPRRRHGASADMVATGHDSPGFFELVDSLSQRLVLVSRIPAFAPLVERIKSLAMQLSAFTEVMIGNNEIRRQVLHSIEARLKIFRTAIQERWRKMGKPGITGEQVAGK